MDVEKAERPSNAILSDDVLSIVLAGGQGSRLHELTLAQAKPALPVGPGTRLIDFTLANIANSGIPNTMVLTQYASHGLRDHVERCWGASPSASSFSVLDGKDHGPFQGTAHAVASVVAEVDRLEPRHIVVLAGDHLYQMDYRPFLDRHLACDADVTIGVVHVPLEQASGFGVLTAGIDYRISAFVEKPAQAPEALDRPGHALASMGIYVFAWPVLRRLLLDMAGTVPELDFGKHVIPALVARGAAVAYALPGRGGHGPLWQDLGTIDAYHRVQRDLAEGALPLDPTWPITYTGDAAVTDCETIGLGSVLNNVVLLPGARVGRNVTLTDAIVLGDAVVPEGFDLDESIARHGAWCTTSERGIRVLSVPALEKLASRQRRTVPAVVEAVKAAPREAARRFAERVVPVASAL